MATPRAQDRAGRSAVRQGADATVRHFRQILLWPLELMAAPDAGAAPWELTDGGPAAL